MKKEQAISQKHWESGWADLDEKIIFYAHINILKSKVHAKN